MPNLNRSIDEIIARYDVVVVRLGVPIDQILLERAERLKCVISPTTGLDHIDLEYAQKSGIRVISLRGETTFLESIPSTAEHTWALLMAIVKNIPKALEDVAEGQWRRQKFRGHNLRGRILGLLGLGRVGKQVASFAKAFGMEVIAHDADASIQLDDVEIVSVDKLFQDADYLSIHIPLSENTEGCISNSLLEQSKKGQIIVNTSRGGVWDELAVYRHLRSGVLSGVATDVLSGELNGRWEDSPLINGLREGLNVLITPHIAGATFESMHMTEDFVVEEFCRSELFSRGEGFYK